MLTFAFTLELHYSRNVAFSTENEATFANKPGMRVLTIASTERALERRPSQ